MPDEERSPARDLVDNLRAACDQIKAKLIGEIDVPKAVVAIKAEIHEIFTAILQRDCPTVVVDEIDYKDEQFHIRLTEACVKARKDAEAGFIKWVKEEDSRNRTLKAFLSQHRKGKHHG